jgi:hypothetical protein
MPVQALPIPVAGIRYLDVAEADDLAALLPGLAAYRAADDAAKAAALDEATADVDAAMPYQGRKRDPAQPREFPRADDGPAGPGSGLDSGTSGVAGGPAVVPDDVLRATLYQADAILAGAREPRLSAQHDGVVYELTGQLAESYKATPGAGLRTGLCRRAWVLARKYRLRSGRLE